MKILTFLTTLIATLLFVTQIQAKQKFYKWTDAEGNTHYTATKPPNIEAKELKIKNNTSSNIQSKNSSKESEPVETGEAVSAIETETEKTPEQKAIEQYNKDEKERVEALQNKENCKIARKNLQTLQQTVRVRKTNPATGEIVRMDDKQRVAMLKKAKESISKLCK